jgi:hypothetical protein
VRQAIEMGHAAPSAAQDGCTVAGFDVKVQGALTIASNRIHLVVVWWHQRNGEPDRFTHIAYDSLLKSDTASVLFSELQAPFEENLICDRVCRNPSDCSCADDFQIALGSVMLVQDTDADGVVSMDELVQEQVGGSSSAVGWAAQPLSDPPDQMLRLVDRDAHIPGGYCLYQMTEFQTIQRADSYVSPINIQTCAIGDTACTFPTFEVLSFVHQVDPGRSWGLNRYGL